MPPLAAIERFFERLFERPTARLFRTRIQPVQLQRRIERAMESDRLAATDRTLVPNRFIVHLHPDDLAGFGELSGSMATELADGALSFARAHHYTLADRPRVDILSDPTMDRADIRVEARFADPIAGRIGMPSSGAVGAGETGEALPIDPTATMVFTVPRPSAPRARIAVRDPDGSSRVVMVADGELTIGRATDNGLIAHDAQVSRHHGRIVGRRGTLVYEDLGSTNGTRVNDEPVREVVLGTGDRIAIGDTILVIEAAESG